MKKITLYTHIILLAGAFTFPALAQEEDKVWTLEECIRYAIEHNIDLKQKEQVEESRKVDLNTSKNSWLPNLNASLGQDFSFGRSQSTNNVIVDQNASSSSLGIQANMPLFTGLRVYNEIQARKLNLKAATENLNKAKEDVAIGVASYYIQVLYNTEILRVADLQVELSKDQVTKTQALVDAGKVPLSQLYDIKAQLAKDEVTQTDARNNVDLALLDLAQALEMERSGKELRISNPVADNPVELYMSSILPPDDIYNHAVTFKPQIKEQEYLVESNKKMLKVARAAYFPQLSLYLFVFYKY